MAARIEKTEIKINNDTCLDDVLENTFDVRSKENIKKIEDMDYLTDYLIKNTADPDKNIGLRIVNTLIFHPREDVVASSLGKLYFLFNDKQIHEIIIEKLKELRLSSDYHVHEYVDESMEAIAGEVNNIEIFKLECNVFNNVSDKFDTYVHSLWNRVPHLLDHKFHIKLHNSRLATSFDDMIISLFKFMMVVEHDLEIENTDLDTLELYDGDIIPYLEIIDMEKNHENNFNNLINIYALTFRENGHLNHLISLLNDDDPIVRHMGVDGLIYVLKVLTAYEEHIPFESIISEVVNTVKFSSFNQSHLNK
jgi:hypothetical protein